MTRSKRLNRTKRALFSRRPGRNALAATGVALLTVLVLGGCSESEFVSADPTNGGAGIAYPLDRSVAVAAMSPETDTGGIERTVEEGDIYRVLSDSLLLNLNRYRGLQIIDFSDPDDPEIIGHYRVSGSPVELYTVGDRAYVLMNHWRRYYGTLEEQSLNTDIGGLVLCLDISDPTSPQQLSRVALPGNISTSRLTRGEDESALYIVSGGYALWPEADGSESWQAKTHAVSFDLSGASLEERDRIDLGGYVSGVQASTEALLVARSDWQAEAGGYLSRVSLIDIRDPGGSMREGDEVEVAGRIGSQFNMDLHEGILRVVSTNPSLNGGTNQLDTFSADDIDQLDPIDHVEFGAGQQLFATLFLGNKAFFVTYFRVDPFHAFSIDSEGHAREEAEFVVSGWNDFFRAVHDGRRLVGIGVDDQDGRKAAVSLYDVTDLSNPEPLMARVDIEGSSAWSEASWDHRAFSVVEDSVDVAGPGGVRETGLVLLPFSGYDRESHYFHYGVQIMTFSDDTLTLRGVMEEDDAVRRSFLAGDDLTANLSDPRLSLFDTRAPDAPSPLGSIALAPNYLDFFAYGDYGARVESESDFFGWLAWAFLSFSPAASEETTVEIVSLNEDPDSADAIARLDIPGSATLHQVGELMVSVEALSIDCGDGAPGEQARIRVFDLSDPTAPFETGSVVTKELRSGQYPCLPAGMGVEPDQAWRLSPKVVPVKNALIFLHEQWVREGSGRRVCEEQPLQEGQVEATLHCYDSLYRSWTRYGLVVLDLTEPSSPRVAPLLELPKADQGVGLLPDGSDLWLSFKHSEPGSDPARPQSRFYIRRLDLSRPSSPIADEAINVPGELLAVTEDTLFTRDFEWTDLGIESSIARLRLIEGHAILEARRRFPGQQITSVRLDGAGHIVVSGGGFWGPYYRSLQADVLTSVPYQNAYTLSIIDAESEALEILSEVELNSWAQLQDVQAGRALFQVWGGVLVYNLDDPVAPYPQAFFATQGWPRSVVVADRNILVPAGRHGIYAFDLDEFNLATPE